MAQATAVAHLAARWDEIAHRTRVLELLSRWWSLQVRLNHLEVALLQPVETPQSAVDEAGPPPALEERASETHARLHGELLRLGFTTWRFVRVPADYYDQPLEYRRGCLAAASVHHLCKTIVCENTRLHPSALHPDPLHPSNWADWRNSRYWFVVVQYSARLHFEKLKSLIHKLNEGRVGKQFFNIRLAPEDVNDALTGYSHNAVSPLGTAVTLPIIMSHSIVRLEPDFFFCGAGEVDLKVGFPASQFVAAFKPIVADITY